MEFIEKAIGNCTDGGWVDGWRREGGIDDGWVDGGGKGGRGIDDGWVEEGGLMVGGWVEGE